jgi:hypothetical protein
MRKKGEVYRKFNGTEEDLIVKKKLNGQPTLINHIIRPSIPAKGMRVIGKTYRNKVKPELWSSEYREHIIYQLIFKLIRPFRPKLSEVARELGLTIHTIQSVIRTKQFIDIKNSLRKELRAEWGADIDAVVVKKALQGSKYHAELFYKLEGELVDKVSVKHEESIPADPEERRMLIRKYLKELGSGPEGVGIMDKEAVDNLIKSVK